MPSSEPSSPTDNEVSAYVRVALERKYREVVGHLEQASKMPDGWKDTQEYDEVLKARDERVRSASEKVAAVATTIRLFIPDWDASAMPPLVRRTRKLPFQYGALSATILDLLRDAEGPLSNKDFVALVRNALNMKTLTTEQRKTLGTSVRQTLRNLIDRGVVRGQGKPMQYSLALEEEME